MKWIPTIVITMALVLSVYENKGLNDSIAELEKEKEALQDRVEYVQSAWGKTANQLVRCKETESYLRNKSEMLVWTP